jgi:hypothetical protein
MGSPRAALIAPSIPASARRVSGGTSAKRRTLSAFTPGRPEVEPGAGEARRLIETQVVEALPAELESALLEIAEGKAHTAVAWET